MDAEERRRELAAFLRARRAAAHPAAVGLPDDGRRRTPGLRREEVAVLAGVGVTWYTWLEQARAVHPSVEVVDALAGVLGLDVVEHDHLRRLAGHPPTAGRDGAPLPTALQGLVDALAAPAYVMDRRWDLVVWNRAQELLLPELATVAPGDRNIAWLLFTAPSLRATMPDWEPVARRFLALLRAQRAADDAVEGLLARLGEVPAFAERWFDAEVRPFEPIVRRFHHPALGRLAFHPHRLVVAERPGLTLVAYTPADAPTAQALANS